MVTRLHEVNIPLYYHRELLLLRFVSGPTAVLAPGISWILAPKLYKSPPDAVAEMRPTVLYMGELRPEVRGGTGLGLLGYPPTWVIRWLKVALALTPLYILVFVLFLTVSMEKTPRVFLTAPGETVEDFLQRTGRCEHVVKPRDNSTNETEWKAYRICEHLAATEKEYFSVRNSTVNPFQHEFLISGSQICDGGTDVILLIHSLHDYYDRRKAIRETWGDAVRHNTWPHKRMNMTVKMAFVFGINRNATWEGILKKENDLYGDVIQGDFYEHYHNMTLKSLLALKWVSQYCSGAKYIVKSDDDMIINFPLLLKVLQSKNFTWSIMGPINIGSRVYRKASKWSLSRDLYPFYHFPPYEAGSTYVISGDLAKPLFAASQRVPSIFIDDVYITGILGKILKVNHVMQKGFAYWVDKKPTICSIRDNYIITGTRMKPAQQYQIWAGLHQEHHCPPNSNRTIRVV